MWLNSHLSLSISLLDVLMLTLSTWKIISHGINFSHLVSSCEKCEILHHTKTFCYTVQVHFVYAVIPVDGFAPMHVAEHTHTHNHRKITMHIDSNVTQTFKQLVLDNSHISI